VPRVVLLCSDAEGGTLGANRKPSYLPRAPIEQLLGSAVLFSFRRLATGYEELSSQVCHY
jgi:hypothetical protein